MSYIDKTLLTGEAVTYKAKVYWWVFVYPMKFLLFGLLLKPSLSENRSGDEFSTSERWALLPEALPIPIIISPIL